MKKQKERVPEFNDIIFENRNKKYGAYDLRKRHSSTTGISIIGGTLLFTLLMFLLTFTMKNGDAITKPPEVIIEPPKPFIREVAPPVPQPKMPEMLAKAVKNVAPDVVEGNLDTETSIPLTGDVTETVPDTQGIGEGSFIADPDPIIPEPTMQEVILFPEEMPEFPGGDAALMRFINENINYPYDALYNNIEGRVVLKFVVQPDGSIGKLEIIKSVDPSLDNEAIRVVKLLPKFIPGKQGGEPVPVWFSLPILFRLERQ